MSTPRRRAFPFLLSTALAAAALVSTGPASAASTPYNANLLRNPGAQAGGAGATVPSWETDHDFATRLYGAPGMPTKAHGNSFGGGTRLFSTGDYNVQLDACGSALQSIVIKGRGGAIDAGNVRVTLKGRLGTENTMATATVSLQFRDADNHQVGSRQLKLGPVSTTRTLVARSASRVAPRDTRILVVRLQGSSTQPTCSALFDNLVVQISPA